MLQVFNEQLPKIEGCHQPPTPYDLNGIVSFKYADFDYAYQECNNDHVRSILRAMPIRGKHNRVLIDIKLHNLKPGDYPCIPGWHLDGSLDVAGVSKRPETFTLFLAGNVANTRFLSTPVLLDVDESWNFAQVSKECGKLIPDYAPEWYVPNCTFVTYGNKHFHRGVRSNLRATRLLIRTTETDVIKPQNRVFTPYAHSNFE